MRNGTPRITLNYSRKGYVTTGVIAYPLKSHCKGRRTAGKISFEICLFGSLHSTSVFGIAKTVVSFAEAEGCDIH